MPEVKQSEEIAGVVVVVPDVHGDNRGRFIETWRKEWVSGAPDMVQANRADRKEGALVGLHYHLHQADYWYVPFGRALVVLHDLRASSPTGGPVRPPRPEPRAGGRPRLAVLRGRAR